MSRTKKGPTICVVDTNVPKVANLAAKPDPESDVPEECVLACIDAIEDVIKRRSVVLDAGDDIFDEYAQQLDFKGQPGLGDIFMKWVHDHRHSLPEHQRVAITASGDSYLECPSLPDLPGLGSFDRSDRKFIAVANAHPQKPPVLQATDSKWWGWKEELEKVGIKVIFLCKKYAEEKFAKKILNH